MERYIVSENMPFSNRTQGLFQKIRTCVRYNQKRAGKTIEKAQLWIVTPFLPKFRASTTLHPPKGYMFLEFLVESKAFHFSKRACKKWLKKALEPLILLVSAVFLQKISSFWQKQCVYAKQQCESCVKDFVFLFSVFLR